ncbi:sigma-70 family RNA polymerase sigma factor [Bacillus sp. DX4.1]|uniref:sigma-70 family RNA polymerase sigma factor n=1 Tax=Bacillus sp. DX4.1 TaxID=3055867 RepID=UPI0025A02FF8|nr:sigma-70 family RNA polymerase sigma factor [Bacillus sp. DX4.1]MDM5190244.1 sigma-70 family RNA polymerase sigma factor [Bacillus sp. DX4.1]
MKITEENVVKQLRKRNEKALYFVIDQYGGLIRSIIRKHLSSLEDVQEECMDDILLAIWDHIDKFEEEKNTFKNWLAAVTKYKAIDYCRKYAKIAERQTVEQADDITVENKTLEDKVSSEMEHMLNHLKKEDKEIFVKRYVEEDSVEEIAKDMGVQHSFIYNRLSRGRKKLRALFTDSRAK